VSEVRKMLRDKIATLALATVIFFSMLPMFSAPAIATTTYEYLIITSTQLSDEFQSLADWKAKWVDGAKVETVSSIATDVEIKNIIIDYSTNYGTQYVLLGGDVDVIPAHMMVSPNTSVSIAEDYWFANLDGDEEISEYGVYIGRAPVDNDTEVANFVKKVISYEQMEKPKANLFHQSRTHPNNDPDSTELPLKCMEYTPYDYTDYILFEEDFIEENETIGKDDWIDFWNNDAIMSQHIGHGTPSFYVLNSNFGVPEGEVLWNVTDVHSLNNTFWPVHTTPACRIGNFTEDDCLAEAYVKEPDHGAIACFANYHNALVPHHNATGIPGTFVVMQFKALYSDSYQNIGAILAHSKHYLIDEATNGSDHTPASTWGLHWRQINLIGDPETPVLTQRKSSPETPSPPVGPATGYVYTNAEFSASTVDNESDDIYYEFNWGDGTTTTVGPYSSGENATASHQWTHPIQYNVTVRAKDVYGAWSNWSSSTTITLGQNDAGSGQDAGNDFASATSISPSTYKGTLYHDPSDEDDYYKASVQSGQRLAVCMTPPENTNFDLEIYNASGHKKAESCNGNGTTDCATIYNADSGDWRVRIFWVGGEGQCSFIVSVYWPNGGCPFVYTWNGTEYVVDNNLLRDSARGNGTEVEDYYRLEQYLVPFYEGYFNSYYSLRISEFQQEHSYLDEVNLFAVDHETDVSVAVSPTGEILTYQSPYAPSSAVDENDTSWLDELSSIDGDYYESYNGSFLVLNFGEVNTSVAKLILVADPPPLTKKSIYIQVLNSSESWVDVVSIIPRAYWATDIIDLSDYLPSDGELVVRLYFTDNHRVDFVGLDTTPQAEIDVEDANLLLAYHSDEGFVTSELASDDDVYAELVPGQQITLLFAAAKPDGEARTFIFYVKGYYYTITS